MYSDLVALSPEAIALIEKARQAPGESRLDIIVRALKPVAKPSTPSSKKEIGFLELGQGVKLPVGEPLFLFLSEDAKISRNPDGRALVKKDGLYIEGLRVPPSNNSYLQPAMRVFQERKGHRNDKGEIISLSAWRQWHVARDGKLVPIAELKDPALARRRNRDASSADLDRLLRGIAF